MWWKRFILIKLLYRNNRVKDELQVLPFGVLIEHFFFHTHFACLYVDVASYIIALFYS